MRNDLKRLDAWEAPNQWRQIEQRTPGGPPPDRPGGRSRLAAGLVAVVVAVGGLGFGFLQLSQLRDDEEPTTREPQVQYLVSEEETIDTGLRFPKGAVVGYGSVWIATHYPNQEGGDLLRLDPETGEEQARIPMPALPGWLFGGAGMTTGLGNVWIAAGGSQGHTATALYVIDPSSSSLAATIDVGPGSPADVWVDESGLWVLSFSQDNTLMYLYKLDPVSYDVTDTLEVPASWSQNVFASGGWIYVLGNTERDAPPETLFRIDPNTAEVVERFQPAGGDSFFVSVSADRVWFFNDGLRALDGATGQQVVGPLREYSEDWCCNLVADGRGGVWVMSESGSGNDSEVWHLDRDGQLTAASGPVLSDDVEGIATAYDEGTMSIWVVHYEDTVLRLGLDLQATHE